MCTILEEKKGYSIITYRLRFYDKHLNWLWETKVLYNKVVKHFYNLLKDFPEMLTLSSHYLMRELEIMTIGTKEMKKAGQEAPYPLLNFPIIPLYFRRAAINCAISMMKSYQMRKEKAIIQLNKKKESFILPVGAEIFSASPVYYKGMYKEWKENSIMLKVYTGKKWIWNRYRLKGRSLPKNVLILSPTICIKEKQACLHIPVKKVVEDIRPIRQRMQIERYILAISFPGNDNMAVGAVITQKGTFKKAVFFRGGLKMKAEKNTVKRKIKKEKRLKEQRTQTANPKNEELSKLEERYWRKIENINEYYAHLISRRILNFCLEQRIRVIVVPNYQQTIDFSKKRYLKVDNFEWIGRRVIHYLKYKAFAEGILVSAVPVSHISDCCSECGAKIKRYNEGHIPGKNYYGGKLFLCPNGHQGNSNLNTAKNIGKKFLFYWEHIENL